MDNMKNTTFIRKLPVQEEDIKAWKEANVEVADKIKKYNYNVMTVKPKEWTGHKDDELTPPQTSHTISKESYNYGDANAADLISLSTQSATTGETVTVTLVDPETYTFDLTNKEKQRIWVNLQTENEYHQEVDNYTFNMPDHDLTVLIGHYNGYKLTVTVDGAEKSSVEDFSNILFLHDNSAWINISDLTDVCAGNYISLNLDGAYSFNAVDTDKTHVVVKLNGTELDTRDEPQYREFIMPSENATLEITTTPPQTPYNISKESYEGSEGASDLISIEPQSATAGETVTVSLTDSETYTFDLTNKVKQRIWINPQVENKEYHQEGDYYTFTMMDYDTSVIVGYYNGFKLTVTVDGQQASSIEDFSNILWLQDYTQFVDLTDLTDVCAGNNILLHLEEGYSFKAVDTGKTHVVAKLNGVELVTEYTDLSNFIMPSENATLEITTTAPQS